jgi:predicted transcriptional regulator
MTESRQPLFAMLSQLLIAYTYAFDAALASEMSKGSAIKAPSLAMCANVLQFVGGEGLAMQELPSRCGIAPETVKTMLDCLKRHGWITIDGDRVIRLTQRGVHARLALPKSEERVERTWEAEWGEETVSALRAALEAASQNLRGEFPRYPMPAAHRGAFPRGE